MISQLNMVAHIFFAYKKDRSFHLSFHHCKKESSMEQQNTVKIVDILPNFGPTLGYKTDVVVFGRNFQGKTDCFIKFYNLVYILW
jgi:hypothetical protein